MRSRAASISCTEANSIGRVPQGQQILAHGGIRKLYFADRVAASDYAVFPLRQNKGLGARLRQSHGHWREPQVRTSNPFIAETSDWQGSRNTCPTTQWATCHREFFSPTRSHWVGPASTLDRYHLRPRIWQCPNSPSNGNARG